MPIQINITGEHAAEALTELATLAAGLSGQNAAAPQITATAAPEVPKPRQRNTAKPKEAEQETPPVQTEETQQADPEEPEDSEPDVNDEPIPSVVDLRAKAVEVGTAGGKEKIKPLLEQFGSKSISDIPEDQRIAFMKNLEMLLQKLKEKASA